MKIKRIEEIEDFMHDVISTILPHIQKSDIRPAFSLSKQPAPAGRNFVSQGSDINNALIGFTNMNDFIYFRVRFDERSNEESEVAEDGSVSIVRIAELIVYCYGPESANNAFKLKGLMRSIPVQEYLNKHEVYQLTEGQITPLEEEINEEWWERYDVSFNFTFRIEFEQDKDLLPRFSQGLSKGKKTPELVIDGIKRGVL